ncbi:hypothetical protein [Xylanivirga thermophila]|jgi:hypothetical protein|uniref:hypothetical protein n=1 Tax=Xylanivirga thermophila TaxID=2496273 RepID=UPI00101C1992|nr:hypothetical protein [Xylanivirga thermophila]
MQQTIEVKDNTGAVVEVKPVDIAAGDTTAEFEFVKAVTKVEGIWTVAGISYNADLAANLAAFVAADTQLGLNEVFADLGIKNVEVANIQKYLDGKDKFLADLEGDLTVEAIQGFVDKVNDDAVEAGEKEAAEKAATKAVVDALEANNDIALLTALQNDVFARVNNEWINEYKAGFYTGEALNKPADAAAVQTVINTVNDGKVTTEATKTANNVDRAKLLASKALIETYATPNAKGEQESATKTALKNIDIQLAIVDVREATTPTNLKAKVTALAELVNDKTQLDITTYKDANGKAYIEEIKGFKTGEEVTGVLSVANVKTAIDTANQAAADAEAALKITDLAVVSDGGTNAGVTVDSSTLDDKRLVTVKGDYLALTEYPANNDTPPATAKWIGLKITLNEKFANKFDLLLDGDDLRKDLELDGDHYLLYYFVPQAGGNTKTLEFTVKDANGNVIQKDGFTIKFVDELSQDGVVVLVNEAETAEDVDAALLELPVEAYLNIPKADRLFVAEKVLEARNGAEDKEFNDYSALNTALEGVIGTEGSYTKALSGINTLKANDEISDVIDALEAVSSEFAEMTNAEKADIAEAFFLGLEFNEDGTALKTPFRTLAAVKVAAGL